MNEVIEKENIETMIYEIRGVQVMLDSDLAILYECSNGTKSINLAVKRNINKFPSDFYFQLTFDECKNISRFQIETLNEHGHNIKYLPYVFTEQGVAMLATVIHTKKATEVSVNIMRAFIKMRHYIIDNNDIYKSLNNINNILIEHDEKINYIFSKFDRKEQIFLNDHEYDAYSSLVSIFKEAKRELIIIDTYADNTILDIIRKLNCQVILITKNSDRLTEKEVNKYNKQYHNLIVIRNNDFHDRYFIIDRNNIYHSGASINSAGTKIFSLNRLEDKFVKEKIKKTINKIVNSSYLLFIVIVYLLLPR